MGTSQGTTSILQNSQGEGSQVLDLVFTDCSVTSLIHSFEQTDHSDHLLMFSGHFDSLQSDLMIFGSQVTSSLL